MKYLYTLLASLFILCYDIQAMDSIQRSTTDCISCDFLKQLGVRNYMEEVLPPIPTLYPASELPIKFGTDKYQHAHGNEKIKAKFPANVVTYTQNGSNFTLSIGEHFINCLITPIIPVPGIASPQAFNDILNILNRPPYSLSKYDTKVRKNQNILNASSQNLVTGLMIKMRVIVTPNNYYILMTNYLPEGKEKHDSFVEHFHIKS